MSMPSFSTSRAHEAQALLYRKIVQEDRLPKRIRLVAGVDAAYFGKRAVGAVAVLDYENMRIAESQTAVVAPRFPYVSTLLSFREIPPAVTCIRKLGLQPDVFLVDGHGVAHPYGCGFASHLGLAICKPTIGVAKNLLIGEPTEVDGKTFLVHEGRVVGAVMTTKEGAKPVYVSVGHLISLDTAMNIVEHCTCDNRIPEPLLAAHRMASEKRRAMEVFEKPYVSPAEFQKQDGIPMKDGTEAQIRIDLTVEIEALEKRYQTLKDSLAGAQMEDFEVTEALRLYKDDLSLVSAHILTLYQLKGQRAKITWESLFTNLDTALETIRNSAHPMARVTIQTALNMSEPKIEEVMAFLATLKQSL